MFLCSKCMVCKFVCVFYSHWIIWSWCWSGLLVTQCGCFWRATWSSCGMSVGHLLLMMVSVGADSHVACRAHAVPLPCYATKGLECLSHLIYTVQPCLIHTCHAIPMLQPCHSSQGHFTARPLRDSLWATCLFSASSGYHAEFHEDCYQKHTNHPHNDSYLWL